MFSPSCSIDVAPMIVDVTNHRDRTNASASAAGESPYSPATLAYSAVASLVAL
jgi:hypothetical protein